MSVVFVGGGMMAEAMIKSASRSGPRIRVLEIAPERREHLRATYGALCFESATSALFEGARTVVLAVKPQVFPLVAPLVAPLLPRGACVLSVMAGIAVEDIARALSSSCVVRCIPNTPAAVSKGATVYYCAEGVSQEHAASCRALLEGMGLAVRVPSERYIDYATGVTGSGPAFVLLLVEAFVDAAVAQGFHRTQAHQLVVQLFDGTVELLKREPDAHPASLRNRVTSPGGTTAAGLFQLEKGAVRAAIANAVQAAVDKSISLGQKAKL